MELNRKSWFFIPVFWTVLLFLSVTSCENDDKTVNEEFEVPSGSSVVKPEIEKVSAPSAIIGDFGDADADLRGSFTNVVDLKDASIIVIESSSIKNYEEALLNAYNNGVLIAVVNPDAMLISDWSERNNIFYAGPDKNEQCAIYGFNNSGSYYLLHNNKIIDEGDVPLFHFCGWANSVTGSRYRGVDLRAKDIKRRFLPQNVTHTFKLKLNEKSIVDGHWAAAGQLAITTTANVTYNIYPIHVFDGSAKGDYYAVEAEMVLHNAPMNNGSWVRRRGDDLTRFWGFYLNNCDISASLLTMRNNELYHLNAHELVAGGESRPASCADASVYNPGFEWTLDATVSGGIPDSKDNHKLTSFNNWTWNNSSSESLPSVEIKNNAAGADVNYKLLVNGLPQAIENNTLTGVPDVASGDVLFKYSWIWHIGDVDETSDERFYMMVSVNPLYQAYQLMSGGDLIINGFGNAMSECTFRFPVTPPNRVATCSTVIRNTSAGSYYVDNIRLWRNKLTDKEPDYIVPQTISTASASGGSGVNAIMLMLPAGDYTVEATRYSVENGVRVDEQAIKTAGPISLTAAGNVTIDFGSSQFTLK